MRNKLVSIIIPTFNSGRTLYKCLKSIKTQSYARVEIIVVDKNSLDDTCSIAKRFTKHIYSMKKGERSLQRNLGFRQSKGSYVFFVDSDMYMSKHVVKEAVKILTNNKTIKGIVMPEKSIGQGFWTKCKIMEREMYQNNDLIEASRFFRRSTLLKHGLYDPRLTGTEDYDLHQRIAKKPIYIGRIKSLVMHDEGKITLSRLLAKKWYYAKTLKLYQKKHPEVFLKQISFKNRLELSKLKSNIVKHPVYTIGMLFMKIMEWISGGISFLVSYV